MYILFYFLSKFKNCNNRLEGWNNHFNRLIGHRNPGCFELVEKMQMDLRLQRQEILKWETSGEIPTQRGLQKYKQLQARLQGLCVSYRDKNLTRLQFLKRIAYNIRVGDDEKKA
jgi:hypothetical protein